jgi:heat shock protein HslJ
MTAQPSEEKSMWLKLDAASMQFGEVVRNFEGEADPSRMTLGMTRWRWVRAIYNDGREIVPKQSSRFTLEFADNGRFSATTDCNSMSGSYEATKNTISFGPIASTKMYCKGSQETDFTALLDGAQGYHFTSRGELVLELKFDGGTAVFR